MLDIFYLTYKDDFSQENFDRIKELAGEGQRVINVADINGIYNGHKECALQCKTKHFFVVDGDGYVSEDFDFSYVPSETDEVYPETSSAQCTHVWRAINPVNGMQYGYGGVKLFARDAFMDKAYIDITFPGVDVTTEVAKRGYPYLPIDSVSNETRFSTTPFNAWKSAYRECVKLASGVATQDRRERIDSWKNPLKNIPYRNEIMLGAKMGENYGTANAGNGDLLFRINNWRWLKKWFQERHDWKPDPVKEMVTDDFLDGRYMLSGIVKLADWMQHPEFHQIDMMRRAVALRDKDAIKTLQDEMIWTPRDLPRLKLWLQYIHSGVKNKFNPERAVHYMYEVHDEKSPVPFFGTLLGAVIDNKETNFVDALSYYQMESKTWLIDELKKIGPFGNTLILGGWIGLSAYLLNQTKTCAYVKNIDMDPDAIKFSSKMNAYNNSDSEVGDALKADTENFELIINTSSEHMSDEWFDNVKPGQYVAIQTNDFHEIEEHINTISSLTELQEKYKLSRVDYIGVRDCDRYNRFMMIGLK